MLAPTLPDAAVRLPHVLPPPLPSRAARPAAPVSFRTWRPVILAACGRHTPAVLAIAQVLREDGPQTATALTQALGQKSRGWVDQALTLGREIGLFTRTVGARNLRTYTVVTTAPNSHPPVYPAAAILATGGTAMPPASRSASFTNFAKLSPLEEIHTTSTREHERPEVLGEEESTRGGSVVRSSAKGVAAVRVARPKRPKPAVVPPEPTPEAAQAVLALAQTWAAACRTAFRRARWASALIGDTPWRSPDKKQQRRWRAYYRLWLMLTEHQIDPAEFCTAIAQRHAGFRVPRVPNPASVSGESGRTMFWWWKEELQERWTGVPHAVHAEARASTADEAVRFGILLRHAWRECKHYGARNAVSFLWDPGVIWLLRLQEKAARPIIQELLDQPGSEYAPKMREALRALDHNGLKQRWLTKVWVRVIGPRHTVPEHAVPDDVLARQIAEREARHRFQARRAEERAAEHERSMAATVSDVMASVRRRHQRSRRPS